MSTLRRGTRVEASTVVDYRPYACISRGEQGVITEVDENDIEVAITILWDIPHKGLTEWGNTTRLVPPDTSAIRVAIPAYKRERVRLLKVAAVAMIAFLTPGPLAWADALEGLYTTILTLSDMWN